MNFTIMHARKVVADYVNRFTVEEQQRTESDIPQIKAMGEARMDAMSTLMQCIRTTPEVYRIASAREEEEWVAGIVGSNKTIENIVTDGVAELCMTFGTSGIAAIAVDMAASIVLMQGLEKDVEDRYQRMLYGKPELIFYILLKQCDVNGVNEPFIQVPG